MARNFNGTSDLATATSASPILSASNGPFTVALWFRATSNSQSNTWIADFVGNGGCSMIYEFVGNTVEFFSNGYSGTDPRTGSGLTIADTSWHHIAYRKNASGASAWDKFLDGSKTSINASINFTLPSGTVYTFASVLGGSFCACDIAEAAAWSASLTDDEITALAKGFSPALMVPGEYWQFGGRNSPENPYRGGKALTLTGTAYADHPRILMPQPARVHYLTPAAGGLVGPLIGGRLLRRGALGGVLVR